MHGGERTFNGDTLKSGPDHRDSFPDVGLIPAPAEDNSPEILTTTEEDELVKLFESYDAYHAEMLDSQRPGIDLFAASTRSTKP